MTTVLCERLDCEACHYCGVELMLGRGHEHDHFPIPRAAGGRTVVPACLTCHELKDRTPIMDWPSGLAVGIDQLGLWMLCRPGREEFDIPGLVAALGDPDEWWDRVPTAGRLVYAKLRSLVAHHAALGGAA